MLIEIQALTNFNGGFNLPKRMASGIDPKRLSIILAVLEKFLGLQFAQYDVYLNVTGGLKIIEPAVDLAIAFAIWSSFHNVTLPYKCSFIGEIGLTGELRSVSQMEKRSKELTKLGFKTLFLPKKHQKGETEKGVKGYYFDCIRHLFKHLSSYK